MEPTTVEAIVLRRRDIGENDRVVTLLTREAGRLDAVAKGSRKPAAKAAAATEPTSRVKVQLAHGRHRDIATQWQILDTYRPLRTDLGRMTRALYLCDLAAELTVEHEPCLQVYDMLRMTLEHLARLEAGERWPQDHAVYAFECRLLEERGYGISTRSCAHCGAAHIRPSSRGRVGFSASAGGALCDKCRYVLRDSFPVTGRVLEYLDLLMTTDEAAPPVEPLEVTEERMVRDCLRWSLRYRLERDLRSAGLLDAIRTTEAKAGSSR